MQPIKSYDIYIIFSYFSFLFQLDGKNAGKLVKDEEPDFYEQVGGWIPIGPDMYVPWSFVT